VILATVVKLGVDPLAWQIVPRIDLGPLAISPHGIGIAAGYLLGAHIMVRRARARGGPDEADLWNVVLYALVGAIVGARTGYVAGHLAQVTDGGSDPLGVFKVWEGGISLLGGITGGILGALPYVLRKRMGFWRTMDLVIPGLALGIVVGRIGDLVIGDHLGTPTAAPWGWRCLGEAGGGAPTPAAVYELALEAGNPPSLGCFALTLHQTALYDLASTLVLLGVLVWLERSERRLGFLTLVFAAWYGAMRVATDFLRVDRRYFGLTGSQLLALGVALAALYLLARHRGAPPSSATQRRIRRRFPTTESDGKSSEEAAPRPGEHSA
jgi:phosphatidylglycerol:prolipoprotein diacylglycerol transferase